MNFNAIFQDQQTKNDFERLMQLCNSYGLNEEETTQILNDFKNGSFCQDQSVDQSFHQSLKEMEYDYQEANTVNQEETMREKQSQTDKLPMSMGNLLHKINHSIHHQEQYSFKDGRIPSQRGPQQSQSQFFPKTSQENKNNRKKNSLLTSSKNSVELIQQFFEERRNFQTEIYSKLSKQKEELKEELLGKNQKINFFMKIKEQDTDVIMSLKDTIGKLTNMLNEKERINMELIDKLEKQREKYRSLENQQQKASKTTLYHQDSVNSFEGEQRRSISSKENYGYNDNKMRKNGSSDRLQTFDKKKHEKKIEDKEKQRDFLRDISQQNLSKSNISIKQQTQGHQQQQQQQQGRSGIDISKYKGMIQRLRNSYQFK